MASQAWLIFNPAAGQGDADRDLAVIRAMLDPELDLEIRTTTTDLDTDRFAREAVSVGAVPIAAGGDGTVSKVMAAAIETGVPVGAIPRGTANAFARALGLPDSLEAACQVILDGNVREIDAARCGDGRLMVLWAGVGVGAEAIVQTESDSKERLGRLAYVLSGVQQLQDLKHFNVEIEVEDRILVASAAAVTVANAAPPTSILAQGPAQVCPDDGLLDVTVFAPETPTEAITASYDLLWSGFNDRATERSDVGYLQAKSVKVRTTPPQNVVVDGEVVGRDTLELTCVPGGLRVFVPVPDGEESDRMTGFFGDRSSVETAMERSRSL
ncbi:lipid kinase [Leptolyngbya valderiana BDU 20041]|uniref:YegS/Rv2252/BmrU family lipid kinase n=1 Tax=Baaleninema simplex TaxID=2862350 RepID=UPI00035F033C|nr:YegS/Rv2252/BmrU family lipid kinase [Baaleninema simplex]MDC0836014.1 YegS/Rv2252/BmrU family lipid kinase [Geitlerinema sp. CS-897]OAB62968.1 lipid kinase [Leptolyngbya valderiana BDU 20041]